MAGKTYLYFVRIKAGKFDVAMAPRYMTLSEGTKHFKAIVDCGNDREELEDQYQGKPANIDNRPK